MKDRNELNKETGKRIKKIRKKFGYTRKEMSSLLNMSRSCYRMKERGKSLITSDQGYILCTELEINLNWLITGFGSMEVDWEEKIDHREIFDEIFDKRELLLEEMRRAPYLLHQVMELYHRHMLKTHRRGGQIEEDHYEILQ